MRLLGFAPRGGWHVDGFSPSWVPTVSVLYSCTIARSYRYPVATVRLLAPVATLLFLINIYAATQSYDT